ncbi:MAG: hypothetical protein GXP55_17340, partial [Deltaproteobacteria bacterium]|nr:hypothetical protein [Deltaproteobacteria bacterium]
VRGGELDPEGRPQTLTLVAGQAVALTPEPAEPVDAPSELGAARSEAQGLIEAASAEAAPAVEARAQASRAALLEALEEFETTRRRGEVLRARQRGLARTHPPAARALLPQLVDHSQALIRGRERLLVRQERAAAIALASGQELALDARVRAALDMDAPVSPAAGHP